MITWAERAKAAISKNGRDGTAKTDETAVARLLAVSAVATEAISAKPKRLSTVLAVPSPVVLERHDSSIAVTEDPDCWCWPHSSAMNSAEIDTFARRLHKFTDKGLSRNDGEALTDKLLLRDRDQDDRRVCRECQHFAGHLSGSSRCANWQAAGIAIRSRDAQLPADLVMHLQRCGGFASSIPTAKASANPKFDNRHTPLRAPL